MNRNNNIINCASSISQLTIMMPLSYPFDTYKVRRQTGHFYTNYKDFLKQCVTDKNHIRNMYRGIGFLWISLTIKQTLKLLAFENSTDPIVGGIKSALSGIIVGLPLSFYKVNYQTNKDFKIDIKTIKNFTFTNAWRYEIAKEMIGNFTFFTLYGYNRNKHGGTNTIINFLNGTVCTFIALSLAYPFDLMRVRKQTVQKPATFGEIIRSITYDNNKFKLTKVQYFWTGLMPTLIRSCLFNGIGMSLYEKFKSIFSKI